VTPAGLAEAWAWLDSVPWTASEPAEPVEALGRVLAMPVASDPIFPGADRAARNGYAVRAADTEGATTYNPVSPPGGLALVSTGNPIPPATDAVLPCEAVDGGAFVLAPIASGDGVATRRDQGGDGIIEFPAGHRLRALDLALFAKQPKPRFPVRKAPRVTILVAPPRHGPDLLTPLLGPLLASDGAIPHCVPAPSSAAMVEAMAGAEADMLVIAGRSGDGPDDTAPAAVVQAGGRIDLHRVAIRPGTSSGFGWRGGTPVLLLPGDPLAALASYTLLAARLLRRMTGRPAPAPVTATLRRKITSGVGYADLVRVRLADGHADPIGVIDKGGLVGAARADGFVLVPEQSEGFAPGRLVGVHRFAGVA